MLKRKAFFCFLLLALFCLISACASLVSGTTQTVYLSTGSVYNAHCTLKNDKGTWYVHNSPAYVDVRRSYNDLSIDCYKRGYAGVHKSVPSSTKGTVAGNLVTGIVGAGVDVANGAAYDYPDVIDVYMK